MATANNNQGAYAPAAGNAGLVNFNASQPYTFQQYDTDQQFPTAVRFSPDAPDENMDWQTIADRVARSTQTLTTIPLENASRVGETWNTASVIESYCSEIGSSSNLYFEAGDTDIRPIIQPVVNENCDVIRVTIDSAPTNFTSDSESEALAQTPADIFNCADSCLETLNKIQHDADSNTATQLNAVKTTVSEALTDIKTESVDCGFHDISDITRSAIDRIVTALKNVPVHDTTVVGNLEQQFQDLRAARDDYLVQWKKCEEDADDADFDEKDNFLAAVDKLLEENEFEYRRELARIRNNITADTDNLTSMREAITGAGHGTTYKYIDTETQELAQAKRQAMTQAETELKSDIDAINAAVAEQRRQHETREQQLVQFRGNTMQLVAYLVQERQTLLNWDRSEISTTTRAVQQSRLEQLRTEWREQVVQISQSTGPGIVPALEADLQYRKLEVDAKNQLKAYELCHAQCTMQLDASCDKAAKHVASLTTLLTTVQTNKSSLNKVLNTLRRALVAICKALDDRISPLRDQERSICTEYKSMLDLGIEHIEDTSVKQSLHRKLSAEQEVATKKLKLRNAHKGGKSAVEKERIKQELVAAEQEQMEAVAQETKAEARLASWVGDNAYVDLCTFLGQDDQRELSRRQTVTRFTVEARGEEEARQGVFASAFNNMKALTSSQ
eukprot:m.1024922 g.1024922  ORF g.1024922 m.1024922 type:complete len:675 (+) comp24102_c0_seq2:96-2120(+)